ncbi:hypothetical protein [Microcoleus sp.]|uniref:hypothetical protein n=1 Tax=Microcoleus sp. TaxID=44472 RepID=UPI003524B52D
MITPSNQPLKTNPFNTYRDPVTGKWTVVQTVQNSSQTDSTYQPKVAGKNEIKVERIPSASPPALLSSKNFSFPLSVVKHQAQKSAQLKSLSH